jgi:predicted MFS family arabinose efflux permease
VIAMQFGWRAAFVAVGLPGIVLAILLRLTVKEPRNDPHNRLVTRNHSGTGRFFDDMRILVSNRAFVWLWFGATFLGQAIGATNIFTASYFLRQYHLTLAQVGAVTAVGLGVAGLVGTFLGGFFADRFAGSHGRSYPLVCMVAATGAGLMFLVTFTRPDWQTAVVFLLIANIMNDLKNGPIYAAVQNLAPGHMRTTATAIIMVGVIVLGTGLGPLIVGVVSDIVASSHFPDALGSYVATCPGGKPLPGAAAALATACGDASAAGLRAGLLSACATYALAAPCFLMAALKIREPLERNSD